uniref:Uncharacterized protein LOC111137430 isoform X2 n=1 Tax=Crassostrea virginica TaxID=6565 RepID=A0A8B8EX46_CRAVI|nr:uncharacterized protein LOC111137430 isoform X2 [Crassostrea virginica]
MIFFSKNYSVYVIVFCCFTLYGRVTGRCVGPPHFTSQWTEVEAQTTKSSVTLEHECGEFPAKVELQIRPLAGNSSNFYFPGLGSAQRDDDINRTYGGIVYKYNKFEVILYIPKANDGYPSGVIIYTGGSGWRGPVSQRETRARVRVLVWCPGDLPAPAYQSGWIPLYNSGRGSFLEIAHHQGTLPDLVTVQVQQNGSEWLSDGIGSMTALGPSTSSWGGVIYGYNASHVRIWAPCRNNGNLFSAEDGWGSSSEKWSSGLVKVTAWRITNVFTLTYPLDSNSKPQTALNTTYNQDTDLLIVRVRADTGENRGFLFPAAGAVQNDETVSSFGGVVYSSSRDSLRIWTPASPGPGYLLYINNDWGNSMYPQSSKTATLVVHVWKSASCDFPTTTAHRLTTGISLVPLSSSANFATQWKAQDNKVSTTSIDSVAVAVGVGGAVILLLITGLILGRVLWKRKNRNRVREEKGG